MRRRRDGGSGVAAAEWRQSGGDGMWSDGSHNMAASRIIINTDSAFFLLPRVYQYPEYFTNTPRAPRFPLAP